ncbi:hypothetical protein RCH17_003544 [Arthrobacter sp. MP_M7]|nr:hypothetical protein [Arthrobacter sp. MP_M4]MEC5204712.1 hypothetical protein [Arthrobacter sp. MP_M7]
MTPPHVIDPASFLSEQLEQASSDLMRSMLTTFINALMSAKADAVCVAEYGVPSEARTNSRFQRPVKQFEISSGSVAMSCRSPAFLHEQVSERKTRTGRNPRSI